MTAPYYILANAGGFRGLTLTLMVLAEVNPDCIGPIDYRRYVVTRELQLVGGYASSLVNVHFVGLAGRT